MKIERSLLVIAAVACVIPLASWLAIFWSAKISAESSHWSDFGSFVGGVLSPVLAFVSFVGLLRTLRQQREATSSALSHQEQVASNQRIAADDRNYFDHAVNSLERAFQVISDNERSIGPVRDRLAWLTCARLLLSAESISRRISVESQGLSALFVGEREHWRFRFYQLFHQSDPVVGRSAAFFSGIDDVRLGNEIEERSIRVVFNFFYWPENQEDPIDSIPWYSLEELRQMPSSMSGVRDYLTPGAERRAERLDV